MRILEPQLVQDLLEPFFHWRVNESQRETLKNHQWFFFLDISNSPPQSKIRVYWYYEAERWRELDRYSLEEWSLILPFLQGRHFARKHVEDSSNSAVIDRKQKMSDVPAYQRVKQDLIELGL